jgi:hypothetical protein
MFSVLSFLRHNTSFYIPTGYKGCCASNLADNFAITTDVVNGVKKNVLALTALNHDSGCGTDSSGSNATASCSKVVSSAGGLITADLFASGVYTVIAKVPQAAGLIWAVWTYHYELHMPQYVWVCVASCVTPAKGTVGVHVWFSQELCGVHVLLRRLGHARLPAGRVHAPENV